MAKRTQQEFKGGGFKKAADKFGGSLLKGSHPKTRRPLESKMPIHLVLRSAHSGMRLPKTLLKVNQMVTKTAARHGVKIYEYANVGNHLHLLIKIRSVQSWSGFIRELTGQIAQLMSKFIKLPKKFWLYRPYTRIVRSWQKAYRDAKKYVYLNQLEAQGHISRKETRNLKELREIWDG